MTIVSYEDATREAGIVPHAGTYPMMDALRYGNRVDVALPRSRQTADEGVALAPGAFTPRATYEMTRPREATSGSQVIDGAYADALAAHVRRNGVVGTRHDGDPYGGPVGVTSTFMRRWGDGIAEIDAELACRVPVAYPAVSAPESNYPLVPRVEITRSGYQGAVRARETLPGDPVSPGVMPSLDEFPVMSHPSNRIEMPVLNLPVMLDRGGTLSGYAHNPMPPPAVLSATEGYLTPPPHAEATPVIWTEPERGATEIVARLPRKCCREVLIGAGAFLGAVVVLRFLGQRR